jgi:8-amino-7-oxononanoate synthase
MANQAVIGTLADQNAFIVADKLNHASLIDAVRLTGADSRRCRHADPEHAAELMAAAGSRSSMFVTDGVFSMDGDLAPLPQLASLARGSNAWLVVDDAHGLGVLGTSGRGSCEHFGLDAGDVPVLVGTFGKAFGTFGAFVAGDAALIELLIQRARTYIYTTALPPAVAAATRAALRVSEREPWRRDKALSLAKRFRDGLTVRGIQGGPAPSIPVTTIVPLIVGEPARALALSQRLEAHGCLVTAIRPPTVPTGTARLRFTFSAAHEPAQVDALLAALDEALAT